MRLFGTTDLIIEVSPPVYKNLLPVRQHLSSEESGKKLDLVFFQTDLQIYNIGIGRRHRQRGSMMVKTRESTLYGCRYLQNFKEFSVRKSGSHLAGIRYIVSSFLIESLEFLIFTMQPPRICMRKLCYCIVRSFVLF